jgi:hypothetical protein
VIPGRCSTKKGSERFGERSRLCFRPPLHQIGQECQQHLTVHLRQRRQGCPRSCLPARERKEATGKHQPTGKHQQRHVAEGSVPTAALEVAEAAELFAVLIELLDRPTRPYRRGQFFQQHLCWQVAEVVLRRTLLISTQWALGDQPAFCACLRAAVVEAARLVALAPMFAECRTTGASVLCCPRVK